MNVMDTAKERAKHIVETVSEKVTEKVGEKASTGSRRQAITIARPRREVIALFQDTERLSVVFGDVAEVQQAGPERLRWVFAFGGNDRFIWDCVVSMKTKRDCVSPTSIPAAAPRSSWTSAMHRRSAGPK